MKKILVIALPLIIVLGACKDTKKDTDSMNTKNPFFTEWNTNYGVPPFEDIKAADYMPAFEEAIERHDAEIKEIAKNEEAAKFENTIAAFDCSGKMLEKVSNVFFNLRSSMSSDSIQEIAREVTPMLTSHQDNIMLNAELFERIKQVYENRNESGLTAEQIRVTEKYYKDFVRNGAELPKDKQDSLRSLNQKISERTLKFGDNVLKETNENFRLVIDTEEELAGLPENVKSSAASTAEKLGKEGKWVFQLSRASMTPFLTYAKNRDLREKLYRGYFMRGDNGRDFDNKASLREIAMLRAQKADLLGYDTHADYVIEKNMAESPEQVYDFLMELWNAALPVAKQEVKDMQAIIDKEGKNFKLKPWDWWYYAEKVRKEKYDLDEEALKPYLSLENVREGMFWVANNLYGIQFEKLEDMPKYHELVEVYKVTEANGDLVGLLYMDYHTRDSKRGGAWCTSFREAAYDEDGQRIHPIVSIVTNFPHPTENAPALLSWDQTTTLFHEFGHALHGLFSDGHYARTAGVVPRDYVELPSQVMENFAGEPKVLKHYAKHYDTGEVMPDALIKKIQKSSHFNQGFVTVEYLAASILDLDWHSLDAGKEVTDARKFENQSMSRICLIPEILPRYRSTYFQHIFSGGYSAGYYVYIWAAVLDADAFNAFKESCDIFNKELAANFRKHCLSEVGNGPAMEQYKKFRGQEPSKDPLLERRGLK